MASYAHHVNPMDPQQFHYVVGKLRSFFNARGFLEAPVQHRLSILAACEDPRTVASFQYSGYVWPLPQTGQMWLEYELLTQPRSQGFYCVTTSYRNEPRPKEGRHDKIFQMFEFELPGDFESLQNLELELLSYLGFNREAVALLDYEETAQKYGTSELESEHEERIWNEVGHALLLRFPFRTSPFWNMKRDGSVARKIDVILAGMESIGSAERSSDPEEMRESFHTISDGMYADTLFAQFGRERVLAELDAFLALPFFPRCGGGIGLNRLIRAMGMCNLLPEREDLSLPVRQEAVAVQ